METTNELNVRNQKTPEPFTPSMPEDTFWALHGDWAAVERLSKTEFGRYLREGFARQQLARTGRIGVTRVDAGYAWAACDQCSGNTVKFGIDGSEGCCAACGALWICSGNVAVFTGEFAADDYGDDYGY